jgi:hypothetical protein
MCLACEEQEYFFRLWCADFLARGEMPPGVTAEDLVAMGLPLPKPVGGAAAPEPGTPPQRRVEPSTAAAFSCDSPDE